MRPLDELSQFLACGAPGPNARREVQSSGRHVKIPAPLRESLPPSDVAAQEPDETTSRSPRRRGGSEERFRIKIVVGGFIDDPEQAMFFGDGIAKHDVEPLALERCGVSVIVDAQDKLF